MSRQAACPFCGGVGIPIEYGLPDVELWEAEKRGEAVIGGCVVEPDNPDYQCGSCGSRWLASWAP
jgi:hypothetical protein